MSVNGEIREPFSARTMDVPMPENDLSKEIIALSRKKYCAPREDVETFLKRWDEAAKMPPTQEEVSAVEEKFEEPII
jgi:hypothetical protein